MRIELNTIGSLELVMNQTKINQLHHENLLLQEEILKHESLINIQLEAEKMGFEQRHFIFL
jgi:hypothetical protein